MTEVVVLFRPVGSQELALIEAAENRAFPPRLPEQPIFYPVTNEAYAAQIARDWNARHNADKRGYVTRFAVNADVLARYQRRVVGGREHEEYWIPAEDLPAFNAALAGPIEVIASFVGEGGEAPAAGPPAATDVPRVRATLIEAIDHVQLAMPAGGEDAARGFYRDLLGLAEAAKPAALAKRGGCWFGNDAVRVHCGVEEPFRAARKAHIAFRVDDVAALAARARAGGFEVKDDGDLPGHERVFIFDPFGNRLEFLRPLESAS